MAISHICKRCAERFGSCCKSKNPQQELFFPVFAKDIEKAKSFTAKELGILELENTQEFQSVMFNIFPDKREQIRKIFPLGEKHFCFKIDGQGNCHYLGDEGCVLPLDLRPIYCHLFPFWVADEKVNYFYREECLATRNSSDLNLLFKYFNTNEEEILNLFHDLENEWGFND